MLATIPRQTELSLEVRPREHPVDLKNQACKWLSVLWVCFETVALCVSLRDSDIAVVLYNSLLHRGAIQ